MTGVGGMGEFLREEARSRTENGSWRRVPHLNFIPYPLGSHQICAREIAGGALKRPTRVVDTCPGLPSMRPLRLPQKRQHTLLQHGCIGSSD